MRLLIILLFLLSTNLYSQNWQFFENREGGNVPSNIIETYDRGLVFATSEYDNYKDIFLYKLNVNGDLLWKKIFRYKNKYFSIYTVRELKNNGGYVLSGSTDILDSINQGDPFLLKLNSCFEVEWFKIYHEPTFFNRIENFIEYKDNYLVTFSYLRGNHYTLALLSKNGNLIRKKTFEAIYIKPVIRKNGLIDLIGDSYPRGLLSNPNYGINKSLYVLLDSNFNIKKQEYYKKKDTVFLSFSTDLVFIDSTESSFLTLSNNRSPNAINAEIAGAVMITKNHNDNWNKTISDTNITFSNIKIIKIASNRFLISAAENINNNSFVVNGIYFLIDSNANVLKSFYEFYSPISNSILSDLILTKDNNIVTIGSKQINTDYNYNIYCLKYNQDLTPFVKKNLVLKYDSLCSKGVQSATIDLPAPIVVNLFKDSFLNNIKIIAKNENLVILYPNPANNETILTIDQVNASIDLKCFDATGKLVVLEFEKMIVSGTVVFKINTQNLSEGVYILETSNFEYKYSTRLIIQK